MNNVSSSISKTISLSERTLHNTLVFFPEIPANRVIIYEISLVQHDNFVVRFQIILTCPISVADDNDNETFVLRTWN